MYIGRLVPHPFHTSGLRVWTLDGFEFAETCKPDWSSELYEVGLCRDIYTKDMTWADVVKAGWNYSDLYLGKKYQARPPKKRPTFYQNNNRFWFGVRPGGMKYDRRLKAYVAREHYWFIFRILIRRIK